MKNFLIVLASTFALTACGGYNLGAGSGPTPSTNPGGLNFDVAVSERDHAATLHVGQKLEVVLHASNGMANWTQPKSSDTTILAPVVNPAATAARGVTLAAFQAMAPGQVDITSNGSPVCAPGMACPMYVAVYSVKVTITS